MLDSHATGAALPNVEEREERLRSARAYADILGDLRPELERLRAVKKHATLALDLAVLELQRKEWAEVLEKAGHADRMEHCQSFGSQLWRAVKKLARTHAGRLNRIWYWNQLAAIEAMLPRHELAAWRLSDQAMLCLAIFDHASRGWDDLQEGSRLPRLIITGFDPYFLDFDVTRGNSSGEGAIALDGVEITGEKSSFEVQGALLPVRFQELDNGLAETLFAGVWKQGMPHPVAVMTLSAGREAHDFEMFAGGARYDRFSRDNAGLLDGSLHQGRLPLAVKGRPLGGPEFLPSKLPLGWVGVEDSGTAIATRVNRQVVTQEQGAVIAGSIAELDGQTSLQGSGGGFISNEVYYRMMRVHQELGIAAPAGHLHLAAGGGNVDFFPRIIADLAALLGRIFDHSSQQ